MKQNNNKHLYSNKIHQTLMFITAINTNYISINIAKTLKMSQVQK